MNRWTSVSNRNFLVTVTCHCIACLDRGSEYGKDQSGSEDCVMHNDSEDIVFRLKLSRYVAASVVQRQRAGLWYPSSLVHTRQKPSDFQGEKILSTLFFGGEVKPSVPCRSFTTCKRSLNVTCKQAFRQNYRIFLAHSSTFRRWVLSRGDRHGDAWWRNLERLTKIAQ